jgi:hypothetical protein
VADVNANANVAGGGVSMAQRVWTGDAGHILVEERSRRAASVEPVVAVPTDLREYTRKARVEVLCNLVAADLGNAQRPRKLGAGPRGGFNSR